MAGDGFLVAGGRLGAEEWREHSGSAETAALRFSARTWRMNGLRRA